MELGASSHLRFVRSSHRTLNPDLGIGLHLVTTQQRISILGAEIV